jgi:hypothetical protein
MKTSSVKTMKTNKGNAPENFIIQKPHRHTNLEAKRNS